MGVYRLIVTGPEGNWVKEYGVLTTTEQGKTREFDEALDFGAALLKKEVIARARLKEIKG